MTLLSPSCLLLLLLLVVVVVQRFVEPAAPTCSPDRCGKQPDCTGCLPGDKVPDPEDCRRYYLCAGGNPSDYLIPAADCDPGEVFDPNTLACVTAAECILCPPFCQYDCIAASSSGITYISSHDDCSKYYECSGTSVIKSLSCDASAPFFDGYTCQAEETRCCRCQPSCDNPPKSAIDPLDCHKFWLCLNAGPPTSSGTCTGGKVFDSVLGDCSATATCVTTCPNVVNTDGCIDPFTCFSTGYFAKCPNLCVNEYYHCTEVTYPDYQDQSSCPTGTVFHPDNHLCVNPGDCP